MTNSVKEKRTEKPETAKFRETGSEPVCRRTAYGRHGYWTEELPAFIRRSMSLAITSVGVKNGSLPTF